MHPVIRMAVMALMASTVVGVRAEDVPTCHHTAPRFTSSWIARAGNSSNGQPSNFTAGWPKLTARG